MCLCGALAAQPVSTLDTYSGGRMAIPKVVSGLGVVGLALVVLLVREVVGQSSTGETAGMEETASRE